MIAAFAYTDAADPDRPGFRQLSLDITNFHPLIGQVVSLYNDSVTDIDIASVVIDTIVPAPGATSLGLFGLGICATRRKRSAA